MHENVMVVPICVIICTVTMSERYDVIDADVRRMQQSVLVGEVAATSHGQHSQVRQGQSRRGCIHVAHTLENMCTVLVLVMTETVDVIKRD